MLDNRDHKLLALLQENAATPLAELAAAVALSPSACSRRVARLEAEGYLIKRVALADRRKLGVPTTIFVLVRTGGHSEERVEKLRRAIAKIPEIVEAHRLTGEVDYVLKIVAPDVEHYDDVYRRLVREVDLFDLSAHISMEPIKTNAPLPTRFA